MEDIVRATGVSRYGLYGTFGNKRELFEQALEQYAEGMGKRSFLRLLEPGASLEHIKTIFDERVADMCCAEENKGCLFIHTAMELAPQDEELRGVLQRFMKRMSKAFAVGLDSAKGRGEVAADIDVNAAGEYDVRAGGSRPYRFPEEDAGYHRGAYAGRAAALSFFAYNRIYILLFATPQGVIF